MEACCLVLSRLFHFNTDKNNLFQDEDGEWEDDDEDYDDDATINGDSNLLLGQFAPASDYPGQQL